MQGLVLYEARICECGFHESTADEDPDTELDFRTCPICAGIARSMRIQNAADDKAKGEKPDLNRPWPEDGRHVRLKRKPPAEITQPTKPSPSRHRPA